jgi:hypothetical protein
MVEDRPTHEQLEARGLRLAPKAADLDPVVVRAAADAIAVLVVGLAFVSGSEAARPVS